MELSPDGSLPKSFVNRVLYCLSCEGVFMTVYEKKQKSVLALVSLLAASTQDYVYSSIIFV